MTKHEGKDVSRYFNISEVIVSVPCTLNFYLANRALNISFSASPSCI